MVDLKDVSLDTFLPFRDRTLPATTDDGATEVALDLVAAEPEDPRYGMPGGRQPFSLTFKGPPGFHMVQGTLLLSLPDGPPLPLFVTAVSTADGRLTPPAPDDALLYLVLFS